MARKPHLPGHHRLHRGRNVEKAGAAYVKARPYPSRNIRATPMSGARMAGAQSSRSNREQLHAGISSAPHDLCDVGPEPRMVASIHLCASPNRTIFRSGGCRAEEPLIQSAYIARRGRGFIPAQVPARAAVLRLLLGDHKPVQGGLFQARRIHATARLKAARKNPWACWRRSGNGTTDHARRASHVRGWMQTIENRRKSLRPPARISGAQIFPTRRHGCVKWMQCAEDHRHRLGRQAGCSTPGILIGRRQRRRPAKCKFVTLCPI